MRIADAGGFEAEADRWRCCSASLLSFAASVDWLSGEEIPRQRHLLRPDFSIQLRRSFFPYSLRLKHCYVTSRSLFLLQLRKLELEWSGMVRSSGQRSSPSHDNDDDVDGDETRRAGGGCECGCLKVGEVREE